MTDGFDIRQADALEFLRSLPSESVDLIITDPPYSGMNQYLQLGHGRIVGDYSEAGKTGAKWFAEFRDDPETFGALLRECYRVLRPDRHVYIMFDSYSMLSLGSIVRDVFDIKGILVWDKVNIGLGRYYRRRHELVIFASKGKRPLNSKDRPDIITAKRLYRTVYPTQKPVALFDAMITASTDPGYVVCDPFVGSGSSAIAALKAGCTFIGADISERAVSVSQWRCATYMATGNDPLEGDHWLPLPVGLQADTTQGQAA